MLHHRELDLQNASCHSDMALAEASKVSRLFPLTALFQSRAEVILNAIQGRPLIRTEQAASPQVNTL